MVKCQLSTMLKVIGIPFCFLRQIRVIWFIVAFFIGIRQFLGCSRFGDGFQDSMQLRSIQRLRHMHKLKTLKLAYF